MRVTIAAAALCAFAMAYGLARAQSSSRSAAPPKPPVQSGVYGFSGARVGLETERKGFIGDCISIFDSDNKRQVAKAQCFDNNPGSFRVALKPGRYMLHGPAGVKPIEIKPGKWVKVESVMSLPMGP
jgi:hypothetical protein